MKSVADFDGLKSVADFDGVGVNNCESDLSSSNHHRLTSIYNFCINLWMHLCNSLSMPSSTFSWLIVLESWGSQLFYHLYREMFPVSFSKWKSLEVHHIKHPVVSASDSSGLPDLSFTRLQPTDQEFEGLKRNYFVWYVACEAAPDEEYWTSSWLRAEAHWESMSYMRKVHAYLLKDRCIHSSHSGK
ncbi:hypothetical protein Dimus_036987 [Dionaea muscipula]